MIVLLHGFTGSPESWSAVRTILRGPSVAPRLLGHGAAGPNAERVRSFDDEVARLAALIDERYGRVGVLAGYSMGGRLALGVAARHPELVASVVAIGAHPGLPTEDARLARARDDGALAESIRRDGTEAFVGRWEAAPLFASQATLGEAESEAQRAIRLQHDAEGLARALDCIGLGRMPHLTPALRTSGVPLRLITGALDPKFDAIAAALAAALSESGEKVTRTVVPAVGHNVVLEAPDVVAAAIEQARVDAEVAPRSACASPTTHTKELRR